MKAADEQVGSGGTLDNILLVFEKLTHPERKRLFKWRPASNYS